MRYGYEMEFHNLMGCRYRKRLRLTDLGWLPWYRGIRHKDVRYCARYSYDSTGTRTCGPVSKTGLTTKVGGVKRAK